MGIFGLLSSFAFYCAVAVALGAAGYAGLRAGVAAAGGRKKWPSQGIALVVFAYTGIAGACFTAALLAATLPLPAVIGGVATMAACFGGFMGYEDVRGRDRYRRAYAPTDDSLRFVKSE